MNATATPASTTECANPNHEHGARCFNCGQPVHLDTTGRDVWAHDDPTTVCYTAPADHERNAPTYTPCVPAAAPAVQHPAIVCTNPQHDHEDHEHEGTEGAEPAPGAAMRCMHCNEPLHYDSGIEDYVHDDPRSACWLCAAREVHTQRGATGCTAIVLDGTLYHGLTADGWVSLHDSDGERFTTRATALVRSALQVQA